MQTVRGIAGKILRDETGATAVEYGLIVAAVAAVVVVVLLVFGNKINNSFGNITTRIP